MHSLLEQALRFFWSVWRFRWSALLLAWVIGIVGWAAVDSLANKYTAKTRFYVDSNRVLAPLLKGLALSQNANQRGAAIAGTLLTRPNIEKLIEASELDPERKASINVDRLLTTLNRSASIEGSPGGSTVYNLSYTDSDPKFAKHIMQGLVDMFINFSRGSGQSDTADAQAFLERQIDDYATRLNEAELRLSIFQRTNSGKLPGQAGGYYQRLDFARTKQKQAELELREALNRLNNLKSQLNRESSGILAGADTELVTPLDQQIRNYRDELEALQVRYTDRHPQVAQLKDTIVALESEKLEYALNFQEVPHRATLQASPVYQQMKSMMSESEARVAELAVRVENFKEQVTELNSTIDTIPAVEAKLRQLDRNYTVLKGQHEKLVQRRETAVLSEEVQNSDDVRFKIIDPPFVPVNPSQPQKLILYGLVLLAALGGGIGLALALALIRPIFYDRRSLGHITQLPVLGSVKLVEKSGTKLRKLVSVITYSGALAALLMVFVGVAYMYQQDPNTRIAERLSDYQFVSKIKESQVWQNLIDSEVIQKFESAVADLI